MQGKKIIQLILVNGLLSFVNILFFSSAFIGIDLTAGNAAITALGVTIIIMSVIIFFYANHRILKPQVANVQDNLQDNTIRTLDDCIVSLEEYIKQNAKTFAAEIQNILGQLNRMKKKKTVIGEVLCDQFDVNEISYKKFYGAVLNVEDTMILNTKSFIKRIQAFDEGEYEKLLAEQSSHRHEEGSRGEKIMNSQREIFNHYKEFVKSTTENNEEMLIRLDKLLSEVTMVNGLNSEEIDKLPAMKEIDELIHNTKWYR